MTKTHTPPLRESDSRPYEAVILGAFFFSGATSLSLEVAWSKELTYLLGVDIYATTTVVTAFMAGLGLGALLAARLRRWVKASVRSYGLLQIVIGSCALISIPLFRLTAPLFSLLFSSLGYDSALFLLTRFLVVFGFMLIPVTLMGMTLPVVVGASHRGAQGRYAYLAGKLYGINTLGAVAGTLAAGFFLIPTLGILKTCIVTGIVDLAIGCLLFLVARAEAMEEPAAAKPCRTNAVQAPMAPAESPASSIPSIAMPSWPAVVFLFTGMGALVYEIIWFRLLARIIGPSVHAFSVMLATYLLGIATGSLIGTKMLKRIGDPRLAMAALLGAVGLGPVLTLFFLNHLPIGYGALFVRFTSDHFTLVNLMLQGLTASALILPATLPLGALFPIVTRVYNLEKGDGSVEGSVGHLYFYNTLGGVAGTLAAGFWLVPTAGVKASILAASGLNVVMAVAIYSTCIRAAFLRKAAAASAVVAAFALLMYLSPGMDHTVLNAGLYSEMIKKEDFSRHIAPKHRQLGRLIHFEEGISNSVAVVANKFDDGNLTLHLSGSWEATTEIHGRLHLKFLGHLPMLFARKAETVAVIGLGAGITTGAVLLHPDVRRVDVFELEPGVVRASRYFAFANNDPLADDRLRLFMVDGRSHITYGGTRYDVITSDPIHPYVAGAANLYTLDYYRIMAERLNPGGIFCQWVPLVGMSSESYNTILNTMHRAFPHMALFSFCGESVIVASPEPLRADWGSLEKRFYAPKVHADLERVDVLTPFNLVAFLMGAEGQIDRHLSGFNGLNTDDNVWLEHRIPFDFLAAEGLNLFAWLRDNLPPDEGRTVRDLFPGIPMDRLREELALLKREGDRDYERAQNAYQRNDLQSMEHFLRRTMADFNAAHHYAAGTQLANHLLDSGRIDELLPIASHLQRNFPAFPEAYIAEARAWMKKGDMSRAHQALDRGWIYLKGDPEMARWRRQLGQTLP